MLFPKVNYVNSGLFSGYPLCHVARYLCVQRKEDGKVLAITQERVYAWSIKKKVRDRNPQKFWKV